MTTNTLAKAVRELASHNTLRILACLSVLTAVALSQGRLTPLPKAAGSGQDAQPGGSSLPSHLKPAVHESGAATTGEPWRETVRIGRAHFRLGVQWLEDKHLPEARAEFDIAVETLLKDPGIDFATNAEAKRELEQLIQDIHRVEATRMDLEDSSSAPVYQESPLDQIPELTFPTDPSLEATVVDQIRARTGDFPLEINDTVLSYVRYFSSERGRRTFVAGYRRSGRYRDMIRRILDEEGLPHELLHLAQAESGFLPRAISRAKAGGLWQFITSRGKEYGLTQSTHTDDRFDPERATRAAARHLRDLFHEFGDWNLAMAAYNCGPACVDRAVARTGYADFWELRRLNAIPRETTNYVPIVQALAIISLNPAAYGIELPELDDPLLFDTHILEANTSLNLISDIIGITKAEVRDLNPSVRNDVAPAGYALRVPKQSVPSLLSGLSQVPETNRVAWRAHRVDEGDTLTTIARQYKTTSSAIEKANSIAKTSMQQGDLLLIPASYQAPKPTVTRKKRATSRKPAPAKRSSTSKKPAAGKASAAKSASAKSASPTASGTKSAKTRKSKPARVVTAKRTVAGSAAK